MKISTYFSVSYRELEFFSLNTMLFSISATVNKRCIKTHDHISIHDNEQENQYGSGSVAQYTHTRIVPHR